MTTDNLPSTDFAGPEFDSLCAELEDWSPELEQPGAWPKRQLDRMAEAGVMGWAIPKHYGGSEILPNQMTAGYERLAGACLVTTFVLTQRNGACQRLSGSENGELKAELLPRLAAGELFATVGISHLTTSRQHLKKPAVEVEETDAGFVFRGTVPWVTGAKFADYIVTGGRVDDGQQLLVALSTTLPGVELLQPPPLLALNASQTGSVRLHDVQIDKHYLIAGPVEQVMKRGKGGGAGSLTTSALAVGAAVASLRRLRQEADHRFDLVEIHDSIQAEQTAVAADLHALSRGEVTDESPAHTAESIRKRANSLVLRASQAYLAACKGAGFVQGHPAERFVREAMFFLVWSCPQPVLTAALREFACLIED